MWVQSLAVGPRSDGRDEGSSAERGDGATLPPSPPLLVRSSQLGGDGRLECCQFVQLVVLVVSENDVVDVPVDDLEFDVPCHDVSVDDFEDCYGRTERPLGSRYANGSASPSSPASPGSRIRGHASASWIGPPSEGSRRPPVLWDRFSPTVDSGSSDDGPSETPRVRLPVGDDVQGEDTTLLGDVAPGIASLTRAVVSVPDAIPGFTRPRVRERARPASRRGRFRSRPTPPTCRRPV